MEKIHLATLEYGAATTSPNDSMVSMKVDTVRSLLLLVRAADAYRAAIDDVGASIRAGMGAYAITAAERRGDALREALAAFDFSDA